MGVSLEVYRQRIGAHFARAGRAKPVHSPARSSPNPKTFRFFDGEKRAFDEWLSETCSAPKRGRLHFSRRRARGGLLLIALYSALWVMCVFKPASPTTTLHDLSRLILLGGNVARNPGPTGTNGEDIDAPRIEDGTWRTWEGYPPTCPTVRTYNMELNFEPANVGSTAEEEDTGIHAELLRLSAQQESMKMALLNTQEQCKAQYAQITQWNWALQSQIDGLKFHVNNIYSELQNRMTCVETEMDNLELSMKMNGIRLFGLHESPQETYWECLQLVLKTLRMALPNIQWSEMNIARVQRLGARSAGEQGSPRPVLVEMSTWADKLRLLTMGRDALRRRGIRVSGELTARQATTLKELRRQGHNAYYKHNKLHFRGDPASNFTPQQDPPHNSMSPTTGNSYPRSDCGNEQNRQNRQSFPRTPSYQKRVYSRRRGSRRHGTDATPGYKRYVPQQEPGDYGHRGNLEDGSPTVAGQSTSKTSPTNPGIPRYEPQLSPEYVVIDECSTSTDHSDTENDHGNRETPSHVSSAEPPRAPRHRVAKTPASADEAAPDDLFRRQLSGQSRSPKTPEIRKEAGSDMNSQSHIIAVQSPNVLHGEDDDQQQLVGDKDSEGSDVSVGTGVLVNSPVDLVSRRNITSQHDAIPATSAKKDARKKTQSTLVKWLDSGRATIPDAIPTSAETEVIAQPPPREGSPQPKQTRGRCPTFTSKWQGRLRGSGSSSLRSPTLLGQ